MEIKTRSALPGDDAALSEIWQLSFGDGKDEINRFFGHFFDPEMTVVVPGIGGIPAAAGYLLPFGDVVFGGTRLPCACIYAVAAHPGHRGQGFGAAVVNTLLEKGRLAGYEAVVLSPSSEGLFDYYSKQTHAALRDRFYVSERLSKPPPPPLAAGYSHFALMRCGSAEYIHLREFYLADIPHIAPGIRAIEYQSILCAQSGGGLFKAALSCGVTGCAAIELRYDGTIWVKELLIPEGCEQDALSVIAAQFRAETYLLRTPAGRIDAAGVRRFGMLAMPAAASGRGSYGLSALSAPDASGTPPYFGLAFD